MHVAGRSIEHLPRAEMSHERTKHAHTLTVLLSFVVLEADVRLTRQLSRLKISDSLEDAKLKQQQTGRGPVRVAGRAIERLLRAKTSHTENMIFSAYRALSVVDSDSPSNESGGVPQSVSAHEDDGDTLCPLTDTDEALSPKSSRYPRWRRVSETLRSYGYVNNFVTPQSNHEL